MQMLLFAFVENTEVLGVEVGDEAALLVGHRHRDDDFVDLHLNGPLLRVRPRWQLVWGGFRRFGSTRLLFGAL